MKDIKVLGSGCANCRATVQRIEEAAKAGEVRIGEAVRVEHVLLGVGNARALGFGEQRQAAVGGQPRELRGGNGARGGAAERIVGRGAEQAGDAAST